LRRCIVDASVVVKWYVPENLSDAAARLLAQACSGNLRLFAPDLLFAEVGNVLWKKLRRGELQPAEAARIIRAVTRTFPGRVAQCRPLMPTALRIASACGRSVYDSLYIALAQALGGQLVTADERLANALEHGPFGATVVYLGSV